jgi:hypothetical protein
MSGWAEEEARAADLGDQRLNRRLATMLGQRGRHPQLRAVGRNSRYPGVFRRMG